MSKFTEQNAFQGGSRLTDGYLEGKLDELGASKVTQQAAIADIAAAPTQADFNGLLAALRSAGVLASA